MRFTILVAATLLTGCAPAIDPGETGDVATADAANPRDGEIRGDAASAQQVDAGSDPTAPTYANVHAIIAAHCTGYCHAGSSPENALDFADGAWTMANVLVPSAELPRLRIVEPGDPARSYLLYKIDGTLTSLDECRVDAQRCGTVMPWSSQPAVTLAGSDRALIRAWIAAGAPGE
jgi:hypothetical protein